MASDSVPHDHSTEQPTTLIPVQVDNVDQLNAIARNLEGFVLILGAASAGHPAFAAVESILRPTHEQLQEFKDWFDRAWQIATNATK